MATLLQPGSECGQGGHTGREDRFVIFCPDDGFRFWRIVFQSQDGLQLFGGGQFHNAVGHLFEVAVVKRTCFDMDDIEFPGFFAVLVVEMPFHAMFVGVKSVDAGQVLHFGNPGHLGGDGKGMLFGDVLRVYMKVDVPVVDEQSHANGIDELDTASGFLPDGCDARLFEHLAGFYSYAWWK